MPKIETTNSHYYPVNIYCHNQMSVKPLFKALFLKNIPSSNLIIFFSFEIMTKVRNLFDPEHDTRYNKFCIF